MTTFLFWNLGRNLIPEVVSNLAWENQVDVIILAECNIEPGIQLQSLNRRGLATYHYAPSLGCKRIHIFTSFPAKFINPVSETDKVTIRHLQLPGQADIFLAAVHFISKTNWSDASQAFEAIPLAREIQALEERLGHSRSVLVGDFNMNPFEHGVVGSMGFHAVMSRRLAEHGQRTIQKVEYPFFYNPMWSLLGDADGRPPGTYYYYEAEHITYFWNMFDQVLLRPAVLPHFDSHDLKIITSYGTSTLLNASGHPDSAAASDHLPILFRLNL